MWNPFQALGTQVSRAGNALQETLGVKQRNYNPDEHDMWGTKHSNEQVKHMYGYQPVANQPAWAKARLDQMNGAQQYSPAKGPLSAEAYGYKPTYSQAKGPLSLEAYDGQPLKPYTGGPAAPATPAPAAGPSSPADYQAGIFDILKQNRARYDQQYNTISSQANPYGQTALEAALRQSDATVGKQFQGAERQVQRSLAGRGMLGSGLEAGMLNAARNAEQEAMATSRSAIETALADKSNAWQQNQNSQLAQLVNGDFSGTVGGYNTLLQTSLGQSNADRNFGLDAQRLAIAKQQIDQAIQSGNQDMVGRVINGLVQTMGRAAETPQGQAFIANLMSGGKGQYPGRPYSA